MAFQIQHRITPRQQDQTNAHQQTVREGGEGGTTPQVAAFVRKDGPSGDNQGQGSSSGQSGQGGGNLAGQHQANAIRSQNVAARTTIPQIPTDSVVNNVRGNNTFQTGSLRRLHWNKYTPSTGKQIRVGGELPSDWSSQMGAEVMQARIQHRPMNRTFVQNGRYDRVAQGANPQARRNPYLA